MFQVGLVITFALAAGSADSEPAPGPAAGQTEQVRGPSPLPPQNPPRTLPPNRRLQAWTEPGVPWVIDGELRRWHKVTITFDGPATSESDSVNPFTDYRLDVTFSRGPLSYRVPGYFAADGDAAETSATAGRKWRVHFCPPEEGTWEFEVSFRTAPGIAQSLIPGAGDPVVLDGASGSFEVGPTDKSGRDFRGKGLLRYVGGHHLQHAGSLEYFLKGGAGSPENLLACADFDGTEEGNFPLKTFSAHLIHYDTLGGGPTWQNGKGKGLLGAFDYLASRGMNSVYFLTFNAGGDGDDVWPWTDHDERLRYDVSKLDQWERVFGHADTLGIQLHVVMQEVEVVYRLDGGDLGIERKIYYRELVARFGHHLGVVWNLGEETSTLALEEEREEYATFIRSIDPYDHVIGLHTYNYEVEQGYAPLLGFPDFEAATMVVGENPLYWPSASYDAAVEWRTRSTDAGRPWIITMDEIGTNAKGVSPDGDAYDPEHDLVRTTRLWPTLCGGGAGMDWYFGYDYDAVGLGDFTCEDWTSREEMWRQTDLALTFFHQYLPFQEMLPARDLLSDPDAYALAKEGEVYVVYLPAGGTTDLFLAMPGSYEVAWYDPRLGGALQLGSITLVTGGDSRSLGVPPAAIEEDAVALVRLVD